MKEIGRKRLPQIDELRSTGGDSEGRAACHAYLQLTKKQNGNTLPAQYVVQLTGQFVSLVFVTAGFLLCVYTMQ